MITCGSVKILTQECVVTNPVLIVTQLGLLPMWYRVNVIRLMHRECAGSKKEEIYEMFKSIDK